MPSPESFNPSSTPEAENNSEQDAKRARDAKMIEALDILIKERLAPESPAPAAPETSAKTPESKVDIETAKATINKAKNNDNANGFLSKKALAAILAVSITAGGVAGYVGSTMFRPSAETSDDNQPTTEQSIENEQIGIKDGYGEKGMWESKNKTGPYAFTDAEEVSEVCGNDECEMIKYAADNQVESFADYLANLPPELQPEGFKGLSILETEEKLESLSPEEYEAVQKQFNDTMDKAFTRRVTVNGEVSNALMKLKDENGEITHENMELVKCSTIEDNLEVTEFYWLDEQTGEEIGHMTVKMKPVYNENDEIVGYELCLQVIAEKDSPVYKSMITINELTGDPIDEPIPTGSEGTGSEGTGSEGTGSEGTGSEGTGSEGTGSEGTGTEGTGTEGTGTEGTGSEGTGSEGTDIKPKDVENTERIDKKIDDEIKNDIGTEEIKHNPNPGVTDKDKTEKPSKDEYKGTEPKVVQNNDSQPAEKVEPKKQENDYSQNKGGANSGEYAPVKEDKEAEKKANDNEIKVKDAPTGKSDISDTLEDLGIN